MKQQNEENYPIGEERDSGLPLSIKLLNKVQG